MISARWTVLLTAQLTVFVGLLAFTGPSQALDPTQFFRALQGGSTSGSRIAPDPDVRDVQIMLSDLGYSVGSVDGEWGPQTEAAIALFQRRNGLFVDGLPSVRTIAAIRASWSRQQAPGAQPSSPGSVPPSTDAPRGAGGVDCTRPSGTAGVICRSAALSQLDREAARLFALARNASSTAQGLDRVQRDQAAFAAERERCGSSSSCLERVYRSRIGDLAATLSAAGISGAPTAAPTAAGGPAPRGSGYTVYTEAATYAFRPSINRAGDAAGLQARMNEIQAGHRAFRRAIDFAVARQFPELVTQSEHTAFFWIATNLSDVDRANLQQAAGGRAPLPPDGSGRMTEFDRVAVLDAFRRTASPTFAAGAPAFPVEVHEIRRVALEQYDFAANGFPVRIGAGEQRATLTLPGWTGRSSGGAGLLAAIASDIGVEAWPRLLPVPRSEAEGVLQRSDSRHVYARTRVIWRGVKREGSGSQARLSLDLEPVSIDFFTDALLSSRITTIDLAPLRPAPPAPRADGVSRLNSLQPVHPDAVAALVADMAGDARFIDELVQASSKVRNETEFRRAQTAADVKSALPPAARGPFWMRAFVTLGEYDFQAKGFPLRQLNFAPGLGQPGVSSQHLDVVDASSRGSRIAPAEAAAAEAALKAVGPGERRFDAILLVSPAKAEIVPRQQGGRSARLYAEPIEIIVFSNRGSGDPVIIAQGPMAPKAQTVVGAPVVAPVQLPLDFEAIDLLIVRAEPRRLDAMLPRMFLERWGLEAIDPNPAWGRFFESGRQLPNIAERNEALARFRDWTLRRIEVLPSAFTVSSIVRNIRVSGCAPLSVDARPVFRETPESARLVVRPRPDEGGATLEEQGILVRDAPAPHALASAHIWIPDRPLFTCHGGDADRIRGEFGVAKQQKPGAMLVLANALFPDGQTYKQTSAVLSDVQIERVEVIGSAPTPDVRLHAKVLRAEHSTIRDGRKVVLATLAAGDIAPPAVAAPTANDVSGIKIGMTFQEADEVIRAHMPVGRMLVADRMPAEPGMRDEPFRAGRLYLRDDSMEFIMIFHEPPTAADRVLGVVRLSVLPQGEVFAEDFVKALTAKYGRPTANPYPNEAFWMSVAAKAFPLKCTPRMLRRDLPWSEEGTPAEWRSPDVANGPAYLYPDPASRRFLPVPSFQEGATPQCGHVIAGTFSTEGPARPGMGSMKGTASLVVQSLDVQAGMQHLESGVALAKSRLRPGNGGTPTQAVQPEGHSLQKRLKL